MKTNIKINAVTEEITMTKTTAKKASTIGTEEYKQLVRAKRDFPTFAVKITTPKANPKAKSDKGLTMALMENLVAGMTNKDKTAIARFEAVKEQYTKTNFHFSKPKAYFLAEYPNWREWLPQVEEQQEEQAEAAPAAAEEQKQREGANKFLNRLRG